MRALFFVIICLGISHLIQAQSQHKLLRKGDKSYKEEDFGKAEEDYRKALEKKPSSKGSYNLGNSIYQQKDRFDRAGEYYLDAAERAKDPVLKSNAYHNLGNAFFNQQKYKQRTPSLPASTDNSKFTTVNNVSNSDLLRPLALMVWIFRNFISRDLPKPKACRAFIRGFLVMANISSWPW